MFSKPSSAGSTSTRKKCGSGARRSSVRSGRSRRMGATHFLMKRLPRVATEMALHVLAYNLTRVINIMGPGPLIAAIKT